MTGFDSHLVITVPAGLADIAAMIGRAMDTDIGGAESFSRDIAGHDGDGAPIYADTITVRTVCTTAYKAKAMSMVGNTQMLFMACKQDYAKRWPDRTPPTLEQCAAFVDAAIVS